jgi:cytochrome c oxidase assembly factor CtaG
LTSICIEPPDLEWVALAVMLRLGAGVVSRPGPEGWDNGPVSPDSSWSLDPSVLLLVGLGAAAYAVRWHAVRRAGRARPAPRWRALAFGAGLLAVLAALVSPLDRLGEQLLVMHMVQHLLLLDVAPVLLILGLTKLILRPATRRLLALERAAGPLAHPAFAVAFYVLAMWTWHVPALYDAAVRHPVIHVLEHMSFAAAGGLYWWHLLSPIRGRSGLSGMGPAVYMASTKVLVGVLGIALAFAPGSFYPYYAHQPHFWGLAPRDDQAAAGMAMALEQSLVMGAALAFLFVRALAESERREQRAERLA